MRLKDLLSELDLNFTPLENFNKVKGISLTGLTSTKGGFAFGEKIPDLEIRGISCDSRKVFRDYLYVAVKGSQFDGRNFISEAIKKGARAIIVQEARLQPTHHPLSKGLLLRKQEAGIPFFTVKDTRITLAKLSAKFYGNPQSLLKFIGITGTNGKTTVSYLIESILKRSRFNIGIIGTINYRLNDEKIYPVNTTPGPIELQSLLSRMSKRDIDYVIMEVSSHALDQERVYGIDFDYAVFTNLSQDHLDYHKNLENYFLAKAKLFEGLSRESVAIINSDDKFSKELKRKTRAKIYTYGIFSPSDIRAESIEWNLGRMRFNVLGKRFNFQIESKLIGYHNVYNLLAAITTAMAVGIDIEIIKDAVQNLRYIPGRLERINTRRNFKVFVDYAHTPEALRNVFLTLKDFKRRLICVFGCGGERDRKKRPKMGSIVSKFCDYFIISNDNPRNEDPEKIVADILKGVNPVRNTNILRENKISNGVKTKRFEIILDRKKAIRKAISKASDGDIVVILGKGHERYQIIKDKRIPFDDRRIIRECLKSRRF